MFERGERDQYPPIGESRHPPLQAFLGPGCRCANTRTHFTQFLLRIFGGGMDVFGDAFRWHFFCSHSLLSSDPCSQFTPSARSTGRHSHFRRPANLSASGSAFLSRPRTTSCPCQE